MTKKPILLFLALCICCSNIKAINQYMVGDTLYVWALSGLVLRKAGKPDAEKILAVPYGSAVVAQEMQLSNPFEHWVLLQERQLHTNQITVWPEVRLYGGWLKVQFGKQEGYVFDGYLSRLPAMQVTYKKFTPAPGGKLPEPEPISDYLKRHFRIVDTLNSVFGVEPEPYFYTQRTVYESGILIENRHFEKGLETSWVFPDLSLEEAYLLLNVYLHLDFSLNSSRVIDQERFEFWDLNSNSFSLMDMNGSCATKVSIVGSLCIIQTSCGC